MFPPRFHPRRAKHRRVSKPLPVVSWLSLPLTRRTDSSFFSDATVAVVVTISLRSRVLSSPRVHSRLLRETRLSLASNPKATHRRVPRGNTRPMLALHLDRACRIYRSAHRKHPRDNRTDATRCLTAELCSAQRISESHRIIDTADFPPAYR